MSTKRLRSAAYTLTLQRALDIVGTQNDLARALDVSPDLLDIWLAGNAAPPREIIADALALTSTSQAHPRSSGIASSEP